MDGVIWRGYNPIGDLPEIFKTLDAKGIKYCFATNNSSKTIAKYVDIFTEKNVTVKGEQIFTSGKVTAELLKQQHPEGGNVFVVGMPGLIETLSDYGFTNSAEAPMAVVSGIDYEISYEKLGKAALLIRSGVPFIGTNPDNTFPTPEGQMPGAGAVQAFIAAASGIEPIIIGKPKPTIFLKALDHLKEDPQNVLVVGDRLDTDIAGGKAAGCKTAVTLSGVSSQEQITGYQPAPDMVVKDLSDLVERL